jgi:hypothetical protein
MKYFFLFLIFPALVFAEIRSADSILSGAYGKMTGACIRQTLATTGHNRLGTAMTAGKTYLVSCYDTTGAGAACYCTQGGTSVSVSQATAWPLKAGYEYPLFVDANSTQISCQSYSGTPYISACPMNP